MSHFHVLIHNQFDQFQFHKILKPIGCPDNLLKKDCQGDGGGNDFEMTKFMNGL